MIIFVTSRIPPDHTGSGKRILHFFEYLVHEKGEDAYIITWSKEAENDRIHVPQKKSGAVYFLKNVIHILTAFNRLYKKRRNDEPVNVWLVSNTYMTFFIALSAKLKGYHIIMQNTLDGDDDPLSKPEGDPLKLIYLMKKIQYKLSDHITCVSKALYNKTKGHHKSVSYIPNPIDLQKFDKGNEKPASKKKSILFVGALNRRKGIDIVLKTARKLFEHRNDIRLMLVGPYDESIVEEFGDILAHEDVYLEGYRKDTADYFKQADLFFFPSRREGMPTVLLEAMANKLPVVCRKLDDITDELFPEDFNHVLEGDSIENYYNSVQKILDEPIISNTLGKKNYNSVLKYDKKIVYEMYSSLLF